MLIAKHFILHPYVFSCPFHVCYSLRNYCVGTPDIELRHVSTFPLLGSSDVNYHRSKTDGSCAHQPLRLVHPQLGVVQLHPSAPRLCKNTGADVYGSVEVRIVN